ncbi:MAG: hypothetical protein ACLP7P_17105 [Rhodomicrobium sp.]
MTDGESCPGGGTDCNYSETHELTLVGTIMRTIEQYNKDVNADPCPVCLRDTMLAVAALLHLQAARMDGVNPHLGADGFLEEDFGEAARESLRAVAETAAENLTGSKH